MLFGVEAGDGRPVTKKLDKSAVSGHNPGVGTREGQTRLKGRSSTVPEPSSHRPDMKTESTARTSRCAITGDDPDHPQSNEARAIFTFLARHPDQVFTPEQISQNTSVCATQVRTILDQYRNRCRQTVAYGWAPVETDSACCTVFEVDRRNRAAKCRSEDGRLFRFEFRQLQGLDSPGDLVLRKGSRVICKIANQFVESVELEAPVG